MVALVLVLTFVVLMLGVLVAGLLRSHADILKALHDLGAGVGDPSASPVGEHGHQSGVDHAARAVAVPFTMGPALPGERDSASAPTISGVTPDGDALAMTLTGHDTLTLVAFLSSGCTTCAAFWEALQRPHELGLPEDIRLLVVTKGPEFEIQAEVKAKAPERLAVIMSTDAWGDYEVPGSPFFVLVDGASARRVGEGVANHFSQVTELVRRARVDVRPFEPGSRSRIFADGLDGPARESANDDELLAAGIRPGHRSLYPRSLADVFPPDEQVPADPVRRAG